MISIIGAGAAGLIMERLCQIHQWPHRLIAPNSPNPGKRTLLLNPNSIHFLQSLGFKLPALEPFKRLKITQLDRFFHLSIDARDFGQDALCYKIAMSDLLVALSQFSNPIQAHVHHITPEESGYTISTNHTDVTTHHIVACDGSNSIIRNQLGIPIDTRSHYYIHIYPADVQAKHLIQRYTPQHILAVIPGQNGTIIASSRSPNPPSDLDSLLAPQATINTIGKPYQHIITPHIARTCYISNALLLANASLTIEPIAAQGLNHSLMQLGMIHKLDTYNQRGIARLGAIFNKQNQLLFSQMNTITQVGRLSQISRSLLFASSCFSSLPSSEAWSFGNRYAT